MGGNCPVLDNNAQKGTLIYPIALGHGAVLSTLIFADPVPVCLPNFLGVSTGTSGREVYTGRRKTGLYSVERRMMST